jgi:hypothetical protein
VTDRGQTNPHRAAEERHGANSLASLLPSRKPQAEVVRASAGHGARGGECHLGAVASAPFDAQNEPQLAAEAARG